MTHLEYLPCLGKSDHVVLKFQLACYTSMVETEHPKWNFNRVDFMELNRRITEADWGQLQSLDVETGHVTFKETVLSMSNQ